MASSASRIHQLSRGACVLLQKKFGSLPHRNIHVQRQLTRLLSSLRRSMTVSNVHHKSFSTTNHVNTIFASEIPDLDIKVESLTEYLLPKLGSFGDKTALVDFSNGKTYTYTEFKTAIIRVASALTRLGYKQGDVMAIFSANNTEYCILLMACAACGIVLTTPNPTYTSGELARHLIHSRSRSLVVLELLLPIAKAALDSDPALKSNIKEIIVIGEAEGCRPFSTLLDDDGKSFPENVDIDPKNDVAVLPYSSGTTGIPKGVMLTHYNLVANLQQFRPLIKVTADDVSLGILPLFHCYGMIPVMMGVLQDGGKLVTLPKFDPEAFLTAIMTHKVTQAHLVPPIIVFLAKHPIVSKFDLSSINRVVCGAAPLGEALSSEFIERIGAPVTQGYGLTETTPVVAADVVPPTLGTAGKLVPNTQAKVIHPESGQEMGVGETGEICFKGPQVMKGYLDNEKATNDMIKDGWLYSGDIGHMRKDGSLVITDRLKELIKYKGFQVPPAELEDLLLKHPSIQDAAVIGIPDEEAGELPRAYVVPKPNGNLSQEDVLKFVEDNVAAFKKLRGGVEFMEQIPKSPSGKILRRILRDSYGSSV